jgi:hypothetical protein
MNKTITRDEIKTALKEQSEHEKHTLRLPIGIIALIILFEEPGAD